MKNLWDLLEVVAKLHKYLREKGVLLNERGFPELDKSNFLEDTPSLILPFDKRGSRFAQNKKEIVLCHFCSDKRIYPRIENVLRELEIYRKFMGAIASDITISSNMDKEWQDLIMLVNQLYMAVLAVNEIKIVPNLRYGSLVNLENLKAIPKNVVWGVGFLGCSDNSEMDLDFIKSVLFVKPSKLLIYGKEDPVAMKQLDMMGISYKRFDDYHKLSKA